MAFEWKAFVDQARHLERQSGSAANPEANLRSAVSRAYYGAFGHARRYAGDFLQFESRNAPEDHGRLRAHLKSKRRKGDADRLEQLRQWRNDADYFDELAWADIAVTVAAAIGQAEAVFASLVPPTTSQEQKQ
jgi:hypothetical protein